MTSSTAAPRITAEDVWRQVEKAMFAVLGHVTPDGRPRSSGVVYVAENHRLYVVVAPTSWKARHIPDGAEVALTVPVRRGGLLALVMPIPPATISFHARAEVHPPGSMDAETVPTRLAAMLPEERRDGVVVLELEPRGAFVTYGIGVPLRQMRDPEASRARVPIA